MRLNECYEVNFYKGYLKKKTEELKMLPLHKGDVVVRVFPTEKDDDSKEILGILKNLWSFAGIIFFQEFIREALIKNEKKKEEITTETTQEPKVKKKFTTPLKERSKKERAVNKCEEKIHLLESF